MASVTRTPRRRFLFGDFPKLTPMDRRFSFWVINEPSSPDSESCSELSSLRKRFICKLELNELAMAFRERLTYEELGEPAPATVTEGD